MCDKNSSVVVILNVESSTKKENISKVQWVVAKIIARRRETWARNNE